MINLNYYKNVEQDLYDDGMTGTAQDYHEMIMEIERLQNVAADIIIEAVMAGVDLSKVSSHEHHS